MSVAAGRRAAATPAAARPPAVYSATVSRDVRSVRDVGLGVSPSGRGSTTAPMPPARPSRAPATNACVFVRLNRDDERVVRAVRKQIAGKRQRVERPSAWPRGGVAPAASTARASACIPNKSTCGALAATRRMISCRTLVVTAPVAPTIAAARSVTVRMRRPDGRSRHRPGRSH